jgi:hypothetical protein
MEPPWQVLHTSDEGAAYSPSKQVTHVPLEMFFRSPPLHAVQNTAAASRT